MHVEFDVPDHAALIERLLEGFFRVGELLIRSGAVGRPSLDMVLQDDESASWQLPNESAEKLTGDCEDLVIWWCSWLRATGKDARAAARIKTVGPKQVHCLLQLGDGRLVDVYAEHLEAQKRRAADADYQMGGWFSSIKNAVKSVGHGISSAASSVGNAAKATYHGVGDAVHYVAHDLPKAVIHEATSGIKDVASGVAGGIHDIADAGGQIVNAAGDLVAGGAQLALHQVGKLGGAVVGSFQGGLGDNVPTQPEQQAAPEQQLPAYPPGYDDGSGGYPPDAGAGGGGGWDGGGWGDDDPFAGMDEMDGVPSGDPFAGGGEDYDA